GESFESENLERLGTKDPAREGRGAPETNQERDPERQQQGPQARNSGTLDDDEGERDQQRAVGYEEVIDGMADVEQEVGAAGVRNRYLLDRVLQDGDPIGQKH